MAKPDPTLLIDVVAPKVLEALKLASEALTLASVRHVVVGGLAVGANGYPRATKDVDFLVGAEAFHHHASGLVTMCPEIPFQVNGDPGRGRTGLIAGHSCYCSCGPMCAREVGERRKRTS